MLQIDGAYTFRFEYMGYFSGGATWIHPKAQTPTAEIILVTEGAVYLREGREKHALFPGDLILLSPEVEHEGYRESGIPTSFFWLHYALSDFSALKTAKKYRLADAYSYVSLFREINHDFLTGEQTLAETRLLAMLLGLARAPHAENKLCHDAAEYIRVKIAEVPTALSVADKFGYSPDHLSRLFSKTFGCALKKFIDRERLAYVKSRLLSTNLSLKEIAETAGFGDENGLIKFFKYHAGETPTAFRNSVYRLHTNDR